MLNEFRQDPVSGDWVLYATQRAKKPGAVLQEKFYQTKEECFFEPERLTEQETPIVAYRDGVKQETIVSDWTTIVLPNKYPAIIQGVCGPIQQTGPFSVAAGVGFHDLVITRDHERHLPQLTPQETAEVLRAYLDRYRAIAESGCGEYIMIFHNQGRLAGATVYHNHSQIISMPMIPHFIERNMQNAQQHFNTTGRYIHQDLLEWEMKQQKRIVCENDAFVAVCPYVSRAEHEVRIFPKTRNAYFDSVSDAELQPLAEILNTVLKKIMAVQPDVDYAMFVHTAPPQRPEGPNYDFYHWHIEIMPRASIAAGLELGAHVWVNTVDPDEAAEALKAATI